ncbi:hypothetical protein [Paludisphaera rhizosphaerae]|uniref:hypothetical protein n=1 Tax=Paludisphaera rhizosphaerae TaxID=2711216 RepID=UPI0013EB6761|nr:hypothetical protein [Paludisphaera rhizosphaerae]
MHAHRLRNRLSAAALVAASALAAPQLAKADDNPGLFGRLFRMGSNNGSNAAKARPNGSLPYGGDKPAAAGRNANHDHDHDAGGDQFIPPATASRGPATPAPAATAAGPLSGPGPSTPEVADTGSAPPITPRSRVSSAATEADPLLTRMALGRSNDGAQFGMFLQIFADGTVIDSEGVHRLSPTDIRPLAELVGSGELSRNRGHCGAPSGDYIEEVHVVVFERRLGRLTAQPFSYSGNPQGCDASVRQLHALIESLQARLSGQPAAATVAASPTGPAPSSPPLNLTPTPTATTAAPIVSAPAPIVSAPAAMPPQAASAFGGGPVRTARPSTGRVLPPLDGATGPVIPLTPVDPH